MTIPTMTIKTLINKIKACTRINDCSEGVILLANFLGNTDAADKVAALQRKADRQDGFDFEMIGERMQILNDLLKDVTFQYGKEVRDSIYKAF